MRPKHHLMLMLATPLPLLSWAKIGATVLEHRGATQCDTAPHVLMPTPDAMPAEELRPAPNRTLSARQVVEAQLEALRADDMAGVYAFASPANKAFTGPLPRFSAMVRAPAYAPLIGHLDVHMGKAKQANTRMTTIPVTIVSKIGVPYTYDFTLQRQVGGPFDGCWMTAMVVRADNY